MYEDQTMLGCSLLAAEQLDLISRPIPKPGAGAVLVRVGVVGICGSDLKMYRSGALVPGLVPGHEFSGVVAALGEGVQGITVGQRVTVNPMRSLIGIRRDGAFAEYLEVPDARPGHSVFPLPDSVSDDQGALVEPLAVALRGLNRSHFTPDSRVVLQGLGTIGLCALLLLRQRGVRNILALDRAGMRLDLAEQLGAIPHTLGGGDLNAKVEAVFATRPGSSRTAGVDLVVDATGSEAALAAGVGLLRMGGDLLVLGTYAGEVALDINQVVAKELRLIGSMAYDDEFPAALQLIADGLDVTALVSHRFPLAQIDRAMAQSLDPAASVKVLVDVCR
ncbi:zinc-dependent alcohol dehydrogenase [Haliea sp. E17]|uniref:zinc-dependent alcohol dehydrogenase n=1 Tax=Haliea sp. E17 TaxID=3401576 RepID=UPI003AAF2767